MTPLMHRNFASGRMGASSDLHAWRESRANLKLGQTDRRPCVHRKSISGCVPASCTLQACKVCPGHEHRLHDDQHAAACRWCLCAQVMAEHD